MGMIWFAKLHLQKYVRLKHNIISYR